MLIAVDPKHLSEQSTSRLTHSGSQLKHWRRPAGHTAPAWTAPTQAAPTSRTCRAGSDSADPSRHFEPASILTKYQSLELEVQSPSADPSRHFEPGHISGPPESGNQ
jgi:hypothetical protein